MDIRAKVKIYLDIVYRRKWWLVVPMILGLVVSLVLLQRLPKLYRAETTILVTRQSVPEDFVRSTVTMRVDERMKSLRVQVLSRSYLEQIVKEFGFVDEGAAENEIERGCNQVKANVDINYDRRDFAWFKIAFVDRSPKRAAGVANRLSALFIDQNTRLRTAQASGTLETVERWLSQAREELERLDARIAEFKQQHLYELPDQQAASLGLLETAQNRVNQLSNDIQLRSERLESLKKQAEAQRSLDSALGVPTAFEDPNARRLAELQQELSTLLVNYTEENPLVIRKKQQIAAFKEAHPSLGEAPREAGAAPALPPALALELSRLQSELRVLEADRDKELRNVSVLRARIGNMPVRQQQLSEITREYTTLREEYEKTLETRQAARRAQDLEESRKGEQFQVQDRAYPPTLPFKPDATTTILFGLLGGLALGAGIAALLEFLDASFRTEESFAAAFPSIPVLGLIPNMEEQRAAAAKAREKRAKKRGARAAVALALLIAGAASAAGIGGLL